LLFYLKKWSKGVKIPKCCIFERYIFHPILMLWFLLNGLCWEISVICWRIFYGFRDKLDRKRQKSAHFQNLKVYFSSNFNAYLQNGHLNAWVTWDVLFQKGVKWGPHYEILRIRSAYIIFIFHPILMRFFSLNLLNCQYGQVCDHQSNIQTYHIPSRNDYEMTYIDVVSHVQY